MVYGWVLGTLIVLRVYDDSISSLYVTSDCVSWSGPYNSSIPGYGTGYLYGEFYNFGSYLYSQEVGYGFVYRTADGANWTYVADDGDGSYGTHTEFGSYVCGRYGYGSPSQVIRSSDGTHFSTIAQTGLNNTVSGGCYPPVVNFGGSLYFIGDGAAQTCKKSTDGASWTTLTTSLS